MQTDRNANHTTPYTESQSSKYHTQSGQTHLIFSTIDAYRIIINEQYPSALIILAYLYCIDLQARLDFDFRIVHIAYTRTWNFHL